MEFYFVLFPILLDFFFCEVLQNLPHQDKEQNSELSLGFILSLGLVALQNSVAFVFPFFK